MAQLKSEFLAELAKYLEHHEEKEVILQEYEAHLDELLANLTHLKTEEEIRAEVFLRFGKPKEIAELWREELSVTPSNMKWLFLTLNILLFGG